MSVSVRSNTAIREENIDCLLLGLQHQPGENIVTFLHFIVTLLLLHQSGETECVCSSCGSSSSASLLAHTLPTMGSWNNVSSVTCKTTGTVSGVRETIGIVHRIPSRLKSLRFHWVEEVHGHHIACGTMWLLSFPHGLQWKTGRRWKVQSIALKKHYRQ